MSSYEMFASGFLKTRRHCAFAIMRPVSLFDRNHGIRFLLSVLSVVVNDPLMANMMDEQEIVLALAFAFTFLRSEER